MKIGIVCYPTVGGSGVVATELGKHLARRGHEVHFISSEVPFRLTDYYENMMYHAVESPSYPLFREPQYLLALATKIVQVSREYGLDIVHAHYAVPHATAAYLAKQMLGTERPRIITTLHGTDITLVGNDPSYSETVAFSINNSEGVTAVSESLKADTYRELAVTVPVHVIPNFLDCDVYRRSEHPELRHRFAPPGVPIIAHVSNFRPVKRVDLVVEAFRIVRQQRPAKLLLVGDGPERGHVVQRVQALGLSGDVYFLGRQDNVISLLSVSDLFLLPSEKESFGLAALEAMACGVPVVASTAGGLPEVIEDGTTGFLVPVGDAATMAARALTVLNNPALHQRVAAAGVARVRQSFCATRIVSQYEEYYAEVLEPFATEQRLR